MQKRKFTVVTQLHEKNNSDLIKYMESSCHAYAKASIQSNMISLIKQNITHIFNTNIIL